MPFDGKRMFWGGFEPIVDTAGDKAMSDQAGSFIWYELMTPDPAASKSFYDAVVGWDIDAQPAMSGDVDYRMIKRSDGGNAGGVLKLTDEMRGHGARPVWLGYIMVDDVDAAVDADRRRTAGRR